jgi:hypothetical protein
MLHLSALPIGITLLDGIYSVFSFHGEASSATRAISATAYRPSQILELGDEVSLKSYPLLLFGVEWTGLSRGFATR